VHEYVVNTYTSATDFAIAEADSYWARTKDYWAAVRSDWDHAIARGSGLTLKEDPGNGSVTGHELMLLADDLVTGETKVEQAKAEAADVIARNTR